MLTDEWKGCYRRGWGKDVLITSHSRRHDGH